MNAKMDAHNFLEAAPDGTRFRRVELAEMGGDALTEVCHGAAAIAGWWGTDEMTLRGADNGGKFIADPRDNPYFFSNKLMLAVSELAEAMEGDRKNLPDDHLPQYSMRAVELADAAIRIFDLAGAIKVNLGEIIAAKLAYNAQRKDHKIASRTTEGGKAY